MAEAADRADTLMEGGNIDVDHLIYGSMADATDTTSVIVHDQTGRNRDGRKVHLLDALRLDSTGQVLEEARLFSSVDAGRATKPKAMSAGTRLHAVWLEASAGELFERW